MNRPIVVTPLGTKLCRPSETVLDILPQSQRGAFNKEDGEAVVDADGKVVYTELVPETTQEPDYDSAVAALSFMPAQCSCRAFLSSTPLAMLAASASCFFFRASRVRPSFS